MEDTLFNVRGVLPKYSVDEDYLLDALKLAFKVTDHKTASAFSIDKEKGLILYWTDSTEKKIKINSFITPLTAEQVCPQVEAFLKSYYNENIEIELEGFDKREDEEDDDITSVEGWRVYTERWGRVDGDAYAFVAIKPAYDNYGK